MKITTHGLKRRNVHVTIEPRTLLAAPCGSGKSTVADAIRWVLLGYVPHLGKRPADTAALMRGNAMSATLTLDDGRTVTRELRRTSKGLAGRVQCSWLTDAASQDEHAVAALALVGGDETDAAEALDIRALLSATPNQRTARIEQLLQAGGMSAADRVRFVAEYAVRRLAEREDYAGADAIKTLLPLVPGSDNTDAKQHRGERAALVVSQATMRAKLDGTGIAGCLEWANAQKRERSTEATNKRRAREEIEARLIGEAAPNEQQLADLETERTSLESRLGGIRERNRAAMMRAEQIDGARSTLDTAVLAHHAAVRRRQECAESVAQREQVTTRLAEIEAALAAIKAERIVAPDLTDAAEMEQQARALRHLADTLAEVDGPTAADVQRENLALESLRREIEAAESLPWAGVVEHVEAIHRDMIGTSERMVRVRSHLDAIVEIARANGLPEDIDTLRAQEADAIKRAVRTTAEFEAAEKLRRETAEQRATKRAEAQRLDDRAARLKLDRSQEYQRAVNDQETRRAALTAERGRIESAGRDLAARIAAVDAEIEAAARRIDQAQAALTALGERPGRIDSTADEMELERVKAAIAEAQGRQAKHRELSSIVAELERAEAERNVFAAIEWACQRAREREVTDAGGALTQRMAEFLADAGRTEQPYFRAAKGTCEIGWTSEAGDVAIQVLSGGEWVLFACALAVSVIELRGAPLPLLLVEAGETDRMTLHSVLAGIEQSRTIAIVMVQRAEGREGWAAIRPAADDAQAEAA